jgi:hypothetical protein
MTTLTYATNLRDTTLDVGLLLRMPAEVPARDVSEMRNQRPNARLILRPRELVLDLAIFFVDDVQRLDGYTSERFAVFRYPVAKREIVSSV